MKYLLSFIAILALIVTVVILVVRGLAGDKMAEPLDLPSYAATNTAVRLTIDGEVNADQTHQAVRITIDRSEARLEILNGYEKQVAGTQTFTNNQDAYGVFLRALQLKNYTKGSQNPDLQDERGYCPDGNRYIFEVIDGNQTLQRFWRSSCDEGTFKGNTRDILSLFQAQVPDYRTHIRDVEL